MSKHTPEPWETDCHEHDEPHLSITIRAVNDKHDKICRVWIDDACFDRNPQQRANAHRIVDCVNALAGIDNPAEFVAAVRELVDMRIGYSGECCFTEKRYWQKVSAMLNTPKEADNGK